MCLTTISSLPRLLLTLHRSTDSVNGSLCKEGSTMETRSIISPALIVFRLGSPSFFQVSPRKKAVPYADANSDPASAQSLYVIDSR